ncbi:hypothetical protein [Acinetobacter brisouii]
MVDLEEKQKYWREQLPKFEAKYWLPDHFSFLNFDMEQGNYVVKEGLDSIYEDDATEIYHRVNTGWAMWKKCTSSMKAEINELKAKLEKLEKSKSGIVLTCSQLLEAFQFGAPDGESDADQMATEMAIEWWNDGHSGAGYYCYYSDYPEEGAIFLGEEAAQGEGHERIN